MKRDTLLIQGCFVLAATAVFFYLLLIIPGEADSPQVSEPQTAVISSENLEAASTNLPDAPALKNGIVTNIWMDDPSKFNLFRKNGIQYLYVDIGNIDDTGMITTPREQIADFLDFVKSYEDETGFQFVVLPYSEINTLNYNFDKEFSDNLIREYVFLNQIGFDGAFVDIEPVQQSERALYLHFLDSLRQELPEKALVAVYSGSLAESDSEWEWNLAFFKDVSARADIIVLQGYDLGLATSEEYKKYIEDQVSQIASIGWKSAFMLGVPTHNPAPETLENALIAFNSATKANLGPFIGLSIFSEWTISNQDWATLAEVEK